MNLEHVEIRLEWLANNHKELQRDFDQLLKHLELKFENIPEKRVISVLDTQEKTK